MLTYREKPEMGERPDLQALSPNLHLSIRNLLLKEVSNDVEEDSTQVRELAARLRRMLTICLMSKRESFDEVAGVDAGSQVLPLASRRYAVISALVYSQNSGSRFFVRPESLSFPYTTSGERFRSIVNVRREAKLFETARRFLGGGHGVDLLLVDGPLALSNWWNIAGRETDRKRLVDAVNDLLDTCKDEGVVAAGVVKRPSARHLVYRLGLQDETDLPDAFLLLQTLRPGERTDIFSPRSTLGSNLRSSSFMDLVDYPIYSFYGRFSREWSMPPIRVDVPVFCLSYLEDVADYCYGSSIWDGIPLPIVRADEEVRISKRFMSEVYTDIVCVVGRRTGKVSHLAPYWGEGKWMGI